MNIRPHIVQFLEEIRAVCWCAPTGACKYSTRSSAQGDLTVINPYGGKPIPAARLCEEPLRDLLKGAASRLLRRQGRDPADQCEASTLAATRGSPPYGSPLDEALGIRLRAHAAGEIEAAAAVARRAQQGWARVPLNDRLSVVQRFGCLLESREGQLLAQILCEETGKPLRQAKAEVRLATSRIRQLESLLQSRSLPFTLAATAAFGGDSAPDADAALHKDPRAVVPGASGDQQKRRREFVEWEPVGVVASMTAWNYPVVLSCDVAVPSLALGNAVLAKPSEHAVLVGLALERLWRRAGLPQGAYQAIVGGPEQGRMLVGAPEVGVVLLTGSRAAGRAVAAAAAAREVPVAVHLELGGKDAVYVHTDVEERQQQGRQQQAEEGLQGADGAGRADGPAAAAAAASGVDGANRGGGAGPLQALRRVATAVADAAFMNSGQVCCAPKVAYVAESLAAPFARFAAERAAALRAGDPADPSLETDLGPLARREAVPELRALVDEAVAAGAVDVVQEVVRGFRGGGLGIEGSSRESRVGPHGHTSPITGPRSESTARSPTSRGGAGYNTDASRLSCGSTSPGSCSGSSGGAISDSASSWAAAEAAAGGFFFAPRVLTGVHAGMRVMTEETFGPVLCVQAVQSAEEAAAHMGRSRYGLTAACYSRDEQVARRLLRTADAGTVFWNGCGEMPVELPWSGRRWSGLGFQLGGVEGFKLFLRPKSHVFRRFMGP